MYSTFISQSKWMQIKILKDRPTLFGRQRKNGGGAIDPLPHAGYGPDTSIYNNIYK